MIRLRVSAVIYLRDGFRGADLPASTGIKFTLDGGKAFPVKKEGAYIFTNLPDGDHVITIEGRGYRREEISFRTNRDCFECVVDLKPGEDYAFPPQAVFATVSFGKKLEDSEAWIAVEGIQHLKIAQDTVKEGNERVRLYSTTSMTFFPFPGNYLVDDPKTPELIYIDQVQDDTGILSGPVKKSHSRGKELFPVQRWTLSPDGTIQFSVREACTVLIYYGGKIRKFELSSENTEVSW